DIGHKLPPIEIRRPWRQRLPKCYARRVDDLKALRRETQTTCSILRNIRREFDEFGACSSNDQEREICRLREESSAALVLLECAEEALVQTIPAEEFMSAKALAEMEEKLPLEALLKALKGF